MIRKHCLFILLCLGLLALPMAASAQVEGLYGCNGGGGGEEGLPGNPSNLYTIDPSTGAATLVGAMGMNGCSGLAFDSAGTLFAVGGDPSSGLTSLFTVDPSTGAATLVGPSPHGFGPKISDISFRSDGTLFGYLEWDDGLGTLNTATGAVSALGPTNTESCCGNGIAFDPYDTLFHANDRQLNTLKQSTGQSTRVALHTFPAVTCPNFPRINALDFNSDGTLFGSLNCGGGGGGPNYLTTINTGTGVVTDIGATVDGLDGIAFWPRAEPGFVPEASTMILLGSGLASLAGYASLRLRARRKREE